MALEKYCSMYYFLSVEDRRIVWDENKNTENKLKHKIGFEDAQYVFADPDRIERIDQSESNTSCETRWQTIGRVGDLLFVVYTENGEDTCMVTVREALKHERRSYNGYYQIDDKGWTKAT
jgi:uncharacterized DUF497 family protein